MCLSPKGAQARLPWGKGPGKRLSARLPASPHHEKIAGTFQRSELTHDQWRACGHLYEGSDCNGLRLSARCLLYARIRGRLRRPAGCTPDRLGAGPCKRIRQDKLELDGVPPAHRGCFLCEGRQGVDISLDKLHVIAYDGEVSVSCARPRMPSRAGRGNLMDYQTSHMEGPKGRGLKSLSDMLQEAEDLLKTQGASLELWPKEPGNILNTSHLLKMETL